MHGDTHTSRQRRRWLSALGLIVGCSSSSLALEPVGDVAEASSWRIETIVEGLTHPWSIVWLADGSALITERPGRLRRLQANGRLDPEPIAGLPQICGDCGQGGLMDLALHPRFQTDPWVYFTYATGSQAANRTALARGRLEGKRLTDVEVLFENPDSKSGGQHFGSRLLWLEDGTLLMSLGDGGNPPIRFGRGLIRDQAQQLGTLFGKLIRLSEDGEIPPDNPFVGQAGARPEIYSLGHRNIQGLVRDPLGGRVWATEHGSRGGDELNDIRPGANHGWPAVTFSMEYSGPPISERTSAPGMSDPLVVWTPSIAPSGLAIYQGEAFPEWRGDLFAGALSHRQVRRLKLSDDRLVLHEKLTIGQRVRDVRSGPDGELYLLTDAANGALLRLIPD